MPHQHLQVPPFPRTHGNNSLQEKDREENQPRSKVRDTQAPESTSSPTVSHRTCFTPQEGTVTACWHCCPQRKVSRLETQSFYEGLTMQPPPAWHLPTLQTPRRKASVQHKPLLHKQVRRSEPLGVRGESPSQSNFPDTRAACRQE